VRCVFSSPLPGNIRVVEDEQGNVIERHDYLPFGEECLTGPLLEEALRVGGHRTKRETVNEALSEYVRRRKRGRLAKLFGTVDFRPDWDYKKARRALVILLDTSVLSAVLRRRKKGEAEEELTARVSALLASDEEVAVPGSSQARSGTRRPASTTSGPDTTDPRSGGSPPSIPSTRGGRSPWDGCSLCGNEQPESDHQPKGVGQ